MSLQLWTTQDLLATLTDDRKNAIPSYFLDTYFSETHYSDAKEIMIADLPQADRYMAPFVLPTEQGKPIYQEKGEEVKFLTPAYIKPKDAVRPVEARVPTIGEILGGALSVQERFDIAVNKRIDYHLRAIRMRIAWMAARGFIDGKVTMTYDRDQGEAFPEVTIDFGRDSGHYVVKNANYWDAPGTKILDDIQGYADTMHAARNGGFPTRMYVGSSVASVFKNNTQIKGEMDTTYRGNSVNIQTGIMTRAEPVNYIGNLSGGIEVYSYKDDVQAANGDMVPILAPKEILLVAPGAMGVKAYGAIYDTEALAGGGFRGDIFPKMFKSDDPSEIFVMHQSAPLPIPLYPNRTFRAQVLA